MRKTILKNNWNDNRGIGSVIFSLLAHLEEIEKNEIFYLELNNLSYSNYKNFWEIAFYQPFEKNLNNENLDRKTIEKNIYTKNFNKINFHKKKDLSKTRDLLKKFIKPKVNLEKLFIDNYLKKFDKYNIASLHIRGNSMFSTGHAANQYEKINFKNFICPLIKKILQNGFDKVLLCTIDLNFKTQIIQEFKEKIIYLEQSLPKNRMHPSYNVLEEIIYENEDFKNKLIIEPIIEAYIMSKTSYSYLMRSNISYLSILYRNDFNYEFIDDHIDYERFG
ncbi:hypothetical protein [Candidatus Pelagibacter sp.]|uniref:hypothetical protein n=1 Tax=Candidatus Pelagibacter sp. TaxID=2024849 RepID=UPI003F825868